MRPTPLLLSLPLAALALGAPALAKDYDDVASLLEAIRSGQQKTNRFVTIKRAVVTTAPVEWGYDAPKPYSTWFYVNDKGRDGDGVLISLPNYYAGTNPFDEEGVDDNPYENDIQIPALARGQAIEISGRLESRDDDSGGYALVRYELDGVELVPDPPEDGEETSLSGALKAGIKLLGQESLPALKAPSGVALAEARVRPGEVVVVSGRDLSDRARVILDGKRLEVTDRRPGLILARVPGDAAPGAHELRVQNPTGRSGPVSLHVEAPAPPPAPNLQSAVLTGRILTLRGTHLSGKDLEVYLGSTRLQRVLVAGSGQVMAEVPAGVSGASARLVVSGQTSNQVAVGSPAPATGFTGAVPD